MAKRCPRGVICTDRTTLWLAALVLVAAGVYVWWSSRTPVVVTAPPQQPKVVVVQAPAPEPRWLMPEPVRRIGRGIPALRERGGGGRYEQIGILTAEGGSSGSAAPDRTIIPLFGREMDPRRGKWNYYTRTDGTNPVQVPVRYRNRLCDDDTNGCDEVSSDDSIHVPALGRSFKATVYRKSLFN